MLLSKDESKVIYKLLKFNCANCIKESSGICCGDRCPYFNLKIKFENDLYKADLYKQNLISTLDKNKQETQEKVIKYTDELIELNKQKINIKKQITKVKNQLSTNQLNLDKTVDELNRIYNMDATSLLNESTAKVQKKKSSKLKIKYISKYMSDIEKIEVYKYNIKLYKDEIKKIDSVFNEEKDYGERCKLSKRKWSYKNKIETLNNKLIELHTNM